MIGATTYKEYRNVFESDPALSRRFEKIDVKETSDEETKAILMGLRDRFEEHHKVKVSEDVNVEGGDATAVGAGAQANAAAAAVPDTEIEVEEDVAKAFLFDAGVSLSDLVDAINAVGATPSDLVAILEALREAGALNAELIVI